MEIIAKEGKLKDGTIIKIRPMVKEDADALVNFFKNLPDDLLLFVRHDVRDESVVRSWAKQLDYKRVFPLLAFADNKIIADVTLHRVPFGWKRHLGKVRIVVSPQYQKLGLATLMLNEIVDLAAEFGLEKLWAEVPLDSRGAIAAFKNAGFSCKAVIEDLIKDKEGRNADILIMICDVAAYYDR